MDLGHSQAVFVLACTLTDVCENILDPNPAVVSEIGIRIILNLSDCVVSCDHATLFSNSAE